jgi:tetrahydromethanopterin S-methyltransferase subunit D
VPDGVLLAIVLAIVLVAVAVVLVFVATGPASLAQPAATSDVRATTTTQLIGRARICSMICTPAQQFRS